MKRNGRPKESALGYSQKIVGGDENELERKLRLERATRPLRRRRKETASLSLISRHRLQVVNLPPFLGL